MFFRVLTVLALAPLGLLAQAPPPKAPTPAPAPTVTFTRDVAPIFYKHCTNCHRPGQMAPMSLLTFKDARPWARSIKQKVTAREMPPWFADPHVGRFGNDISLNEQQIQTIAQWVDQGAGEGNAADLPPAPAYSDDWRIGKPDLIVRMPKPFPIPATGIVEYQYIEVPTGLTQDRWIQAIEIKPSDRRVVHHLRVFARPPGPPRQAKCTELCGDMEPYVAAWGQNIVSVAMGTAPDVYPAGTGKLLKAGSILMLHIHYTTMGEATRDQTSVGFIFAKTPPKTPLKTMSLAQENFVIPPHAADHVVQGSLDFLVDATLWSLGPHNHLRGKSWKFELIDPEGKRTTLLSVPKFDFNWQLNYVFAQPITVRKGSRLVATNVFDNSSRNKANPNPNVPVKWGELTTDEMMFASVVYSVK